MSKSVKYLLLILLIIPNISCEKKTEEEKPAELYGEWEYVSATLETYENGSVVSSETIEQDWYMIQFNQDGYFVVYFDINDPDDTEVMNWSRSGDIVIIDDEEYNIESLTQESLIFSYWDSVTERIIFTCKRK